MVLVLTANIVLCALVIVAVVTPLARAIRVSRPEAAASAAPPSDGVDLDAGRLQDAHARARRI